MKCRKLLAALTCCNITEKLQDLNIRIENKSIECDLKNQLSKSCTLEEHSLTGKESVYEWCPLKSQWKVLNRREDVYLVDTWKWNWWLSFTWSVCLGGDIVLPIISSSLCKTSNRRKEKEVKYCGSFENRVLKKKKIECSTRNRSLLPGVIHFWTLI